MPKSPGRAGGDASSGGATTSSSAAQTKRIFLLALTGLGAFIVGRSSQLKWSRSDYLRGVTTSDFNLIAGGTSANNDTGSNVASSLTVDPPPLLHDAPYYINDRTMRLSPYVDRLWLHNGELLPAQDPAPKVKLILTEIGWNQPDQKKGIQYPRSMRGREIIQAVIDHPLFDPTFSWTDMLSGKQPFDPNIQYFVFFDVETCFESNYPNYVADHPANADRAGNRDALNPSKCHCFDIQNCPPIQHALNSPLFQQIPTARLIFFDCRGNGPYPSFRKRQQLSTQLSIVSISSEPSQLNPTSDMGHPPPAINPVRLSHKERHQILHTCEQETHRKYFLTCVGSVRNDVRKNLFTLHNESAGILLMLPPAFHERFGATTSYEQVMRESLFSAAPRGDNRFSYRFTEVLSSGAIPVIHSDGWVLPFRRELIDWPKDCAVVIPENQVFDTIIILKRMSPEERCRRRRRCYEVYTNYMANPEGTVAGVIESATKAIQSAQRDSTERTT